MALEPGPRSGSPESSGRDSPIPPQWRLQLGGEEYPVKDKAYRRYAAGVEKTLQLFETALEEWADYISFLNRLLKALQARPSANAPVPSKATVAKRLSQCLNPSLPSGVHQKALEVYRYVFDVMGKDGLSRDLPLYLPGLAPTLSFASLSVRSPFLDLLERHFVGLDSRSLRPAMKSIILALLPGLEDETSDDFDQTLRLLAKFKEAIRPDDSTTLTDLHSTGDDFFWQCFFLASVTSYSRRSGALAFLTRNLPVLGSGSRGSISSDIALQQNLPGDDQGDRLAAMVTSPEPGLLVRCFASGLSDEQLLIQRGFLDLLVTHLPLKSGVLQSRVKRADLELLLRAAVGVVTRRDMSLNRRLWTWLLGPEPAGTESDQQAGSQLAASSEHGHAQSLSRTLYFQQYGLQSLTKSLLDMIHDATYRNVVERTRPYRICLSLMDRWEIGSLVIPEIFLPLVESVQSKKQSLEKSEFTEVLRSASVFFDGIESGLIYSELICLLSQACDPGVLTVEERSEKLSLFSFIISNFNVREEEMVTIHAPLTCLATLLMLDNWKDPQSHLDGAGRSLKEQILDITIHLLELIPDRAFLGGEAFQENQTTALSSMSNAEMLQKIRAFYEIDQAGHEASLMPFPPASLGELLLNQAARRIYEEDFNTARSAADLNFRFRILVLILCKVPQFCKFDERRLLKCVRGHLDQVIQISFFSFSSILFLVTQLFSTERISLVDLADIVDPLVRHAWTFLSASEPKYHVETVRCLWHLQTALTTANRHIEASLANILVSGEANTQADVGRAFGVLWSHTLQDNQPDRRGLKSPVLGEKPGQRVVAADDYEVMLAQPLFLILDALLDERTQLYMTVKSWIHNMIGIDRLFLLIILKVFELPCICGIPLSPPDQLEKSGPDPLIFSEDDDLELCLYYLRTLYHVLSCSKEASPAVLASKKIKVNENRQIQILGGDEEGITFQDFFVRVCMACITGDASTSGSADLRSRVTQLHRYALTILHHFLLSQHAAPLCQLNLDVILLDRLLQSISSPDPYVQVLLLDVIFDALKLRAAAITGRMDRSDIERRRSSIVELARASQSSPTASEFRAPVMIMPPQLLKCLQAGLSSSSSQFVLDAWVGFLGGCLPFYSQSIFQILIPLVTTLCTQIDGTFSNLRHLFQSQAYQVSREAGAPESTLIYLLNALEQVLARAHDQILAEETKAQLMKGPDQPQSLFGSMVSGVFQTDAPQTRSATANDRLTVHLAIQDAVRICFKIWSWGQGQEAAKQDMTSSASFNYTSLRMRNRARRLLEHLFTAENLESLETVIHIAKGAKSAQEHQNVFNFLQALDASRPRHTMPALFNSIYSRTNPGALEPSRKSTMTITLEEADLVVFLVEYSRSLDDDAMDEIWQDCITFLRDLLGNPFPHRQTLPSLLEFAAILGEKVDNTNFGESRKMRRELGDIFLRLLTAIFTTRPAFAEPGSNGTSGLKFKTGSDRQEIWERAVERSEDVVAILASIVPSLSKILLEPDRVLTAAGTISTNVLGPILRSKAFPNSIPSKFLSLLSELSRLQNNQKTWKKDIGDAFGDNRFFSTNLSLVKDDWLPLLRQWTLADKERMPEILGRVSTPTTAGIVFGVGATSARLEADRRTQLSLRRVATLILASAEDHFVTDTPAIFDKMVDLLSATSTSSPSSVTRAEVYMVVRALVLKTSPVHLAMLWPVINAEIHAAISSVVAPDHSAASEMYVNTAVLQACKLLDLLICLAPDDFQLHEWLFVTDTIDAVYHSSTYQPVALIDEISEELGSAVGTLGAGSAAGAGPAPAPTTVTAQQDDLSGQLAASSSHHRRPLLGPGGISDEVSLERKDELVAKILRPFFGQLSIYAFESTYAMGTVDKEACIQGLLKDLFDDRSMVKAL